ncbi:CLUMA_CG004009, isoform A [Clunio marinus]|uniref:CLUMA_CG004009, isoform A n=1 Tax=Clunio marinus TaxID=568069 RepID=A0A1J1HW03_9DIPT|nr:CLUMA_CG004009, isoform A [Clunio marinus]
MKKLVRIIFVFIFLSMSVSSETDSNQLWDEIDWSKVVPVQEIPGFWDGRENLQPFVPSRARSSRIVGGVVVQPNSHPYMVALLFAHSTGVSLCGGSLIARNQVLTSAHCMVGTTNCHVIAGAHDISTTEITQQRWRVFNLVTNPPSMFPNYNIHQDYNPSNFHNDIGILRMNTQAEINEAVQLTVFPSIGNFETFEGEIATVTGWGRISDNSQSTSSVLRSVQNNVITNNQCAAVYGNVIIESTLCMSTAGARGKCNQDAGGPLTVSRNGERIQIGIASFGAAVGCQQGYPSGYARITSFRQWLQERIIPSVEN